MAVLLILNLLLYHVHVTNCFRLPRQLVAQLLARRTAAGERAVVLKVAVDSAPAAAAVSAMIQV